MSWHHQRCDAIPNSPEPAYSHCECAKRLELAGHEVDTIIERCKLDPAWRDELSRWMAEAVSAALFEQQRRISDLLREAQRDNLYLKERAEWRDATSEARKLLDAAVKRCGELKAEAERWERIATNCGMSRAQAQTERDLATERAKVYVDRMTLVEKRAERMEKALQPISRMPCLAELLGESDEEGCGCASCQAKAALSPEGQSYDEKHGDDRLCRCGHPYYRHFDTYDQMNPIGCKYCECRTWVAPEGQKPEPPMPASGDNTKGDTRASAREQAVRLDLFAVFGRSTTIVGVEGKAYLHFWPASREDDIERAHEMALVAERQLERYRRGFRS